MKGVQFIPADTLFFRDGTPFGIGSSAQEGVGSGFPPTPATLIGAFRAALARRNGWDGRGKWPERMNAVLGDGPDDLGALAFQGPFLLRDGQPLFPAPRHLLGDLADHGEWTPKALLRPGAAVLCDLGDDMRLPEIVGAEGAAAKLKPSDKHWLACNGMKAVAQGRLPEDVASGKDLWNDELRIGLQIDRDSRAATEGNLYSTRHIRAAAKVSLGLRVDGIPPDWKLPTGQMVPLGGESRFAECAAWNGWNGAETLPAPAISGEVVLIALTPLRLDEAICLGRQPLDLHGGLAVVCACLDRPLRIGGWDSNARRPLPLRNALAPGSALFCEVSEPERFRQAVVDGNGLLTLGQQPAGFGLVAVGIWPDASTLAEAARPDRPKASPGSAPSPAPKRRAGKRNKSSKSSKSSKSRKQRGGHGRRR